MTRPLPVVCITTKTANHIWWSSYQTNVVKVLVNKIIIFVSLEERTYRNNIFSAFIIFCLNFGYLLVDDFFSVFFTHRIVYQRQNSFSNVIHTNKKANRNIFRR